MIAHAMGACSPSEPSKVDIQGVKPGMTRQEVRRTAGRPCTKDGTVEICEDNDTKFIATFTSHLSHERAYAVEFIFCSTEGDEVVGRNIAGTYGIKSIDVNTGQRVSLGGAYEAALGYNGRCKNGGMNYALTVIDRSLLDDDQAAATRKQQTPKL